MLQQTIKMPEVHPIRWRNDGYGTQVIKFPDAGFCVNSLNGHVLGAVVPDKDPIQRGYVKIWYAGVEWQVVDRALTVKAARRRIKRIKEQGGPLVTS